MAGMDGSEWEDKRFPMFTMPLEIFLQMTHVQEHEDLIETLQALRIHFQHTCLSIFSILMTYDVEDYLVALGIVVFPQGANWVMVLIKVGCWRASIGRVCNIYLVFLSLADMALDVCKPVIHGLNLGEFRQWFTAPRIPRLSVNSRKTWARRYSCLTSGSTNTIQIQSFSNSESCKRLLRILWRVQAK